MALDAYTAAMLRLMTAAYPDLGGTVTDAQEARRIYAKARFPRGREVAAVEDVAIPPGIRARVYRPRTENPAPPVIVYFHGGGFVLCDLDSHDGVCRLLCEDASAIVVSVDYRRAPEHRYPAAADDAYDAVCWVAEHAAELGGDPAWLAVAGDSAGGNLAAVTCLRARDEGFPRLDFQLLIYPVTDCFAPRAENAEGYLLTSAHMRWYVEQYLADPADGRQPYASPLLAEDLSGLPPALVITAEHDPLREEGAAYGARLIDAGVPARVHQVDGLFHGTFGLGELVPIAREAEQAAVTALTSAFR
ncbi:alpha/beta hydrolase [Amycolatopsis sp. H20-H5]|uniref:alpha/beta hydrolase n=1 Tax=Amycolatopsis sp. H20-H5 TaxID=3046309 RepID=UPI002DBDB798|nr:alpha/beta hydrolase [Amycolatopsis sp. H20-H5]MEC3976916.1 alpha/beta hydrolase [Amycolatopsis sp. H20-H5]